MPKEDPLVRFSKLYAKSPELSFNGAPCWIWIGAIKTKTGYGSFGWKHRSQTISAHRASYLLHVGEIPNGFHIDHLCRVRSCVNPAHLEPVSCSENLRRGEVGHYLRDKQLAKTHCPAGHPYSEENTYTAPGTISRSCRICSKQKQTARNKGRTIKTHCPHGHEFTVENTYRDKHGWRSCQWCRDIRNGTIAT